MPVFEKLEPPPGGLVGLREKLDHSRRRKLQRVGLWMMVPAAAAMMLLVARPAAERRSVWAGVQNPALVRLGMQPAPKGERVETLPGTAVALLDGIYWVGGAQMDKREDPQDE